MKRAIWFILLLIATLVLFVACSGSQATPTPGPTATAASTTQTTTETTTETTTQPTDEGSIAVLLPDSASSARWEADDRRFFEQAFEAAGVEYTIVNAEGDARMQQTQAEQAITNGAKVILLVNLDSGSGAAIIAQAREAAKVIDYDRLTIEALPGADVYVSLTTFRWSPDGRNVGTDHQRRPGSRPQAGGAAQMAPRTDNNATPFREGYFSVASCPHYDAGDWELVDDRAVPGWDNQQALVIFEQILTAAGGDVDAVFAANDGLTEQRPFRPQEPGVRDPLVKAARCHRRRYPEHPSGWQTMTAPLSRSSWKRMPPPCRHCLAARPDVASLTSDTLNNGTNDIPFIKLTPVAVTKDNIESTVIADGFRTWEEICVGEFAQYCPDASGAGTVSSGGMCSGSIAVLLPDSASSARWEADDRRFFERSFP
ncbi:MAG: substrate-binding domain-containing protein [Anaerolineae bacterium]|nr:substrate-binding domain-containing protein [Anaerolineae bacterium]